MPLRALAADPGLMSVLAQPTSPQVTHSATRSQLTWLEHQVRDWQADGILDDDQAGRIVSRYRADHRFPLARLLLTIGAAFIGIGLIWLVAANLQSLSPTTRVVGIILIWLVTLAGAEMLASTRDTERSSPLVGAIRLIAAVAFGGVVFQAAQTLQVPAYEPALVGWWAAGAMLHAYAVRAVLPLVVGILAGATWFAWAVVPEDDNGLSVVLCLLAVAVVGTALAAVHAHWAPELAGPWRELGATFLLAGVFAAALPFVDGNGFRATTTLGVVLVLAVIASAVALGVSPTSRWEVIGALGATLAAGGLAAWDTGRGLGFETSAVTGVDVLHTVVSVGVYVVVAVGVAVVGALRESWRLTALATVGLVVFTTFQSFAVFAAILEGAWLFLALGVVFLGTGYAFDQARRRLVAVVTDDDPARPAEGTLR
jgi:uncharacterized membrane protein